ncbi:hypothetical protein [Streptomyces sp. NPDC002671]
MQPDVVMEAAVDVVRDASGRWRHPARPHRVGTDVGVQQVRTSRAEEPAKVG